jgi:hypothetical protein
MADLGFVLYIPAVANGLTAIKEALAHFLCLIFHAKFSRSSRCDQAR